MDGVVCMVNSKYFSAQPMCGGPLIFMPLESDAAPLGNIFARTAEYHTNNSKVSKIWTVYSVCMVNSKYLVLCFANLW